MSLINRLTENIQDATEDETMEILDELEKLTEDDLVIVRKKTFAIEL